MTILMVPASAFSSMKQMTVPAYAIATGRTTIDVRDKKETWVDTP